MTTKQKQFIGILALVLALGLAGYVIVNAKGLLAIKPPVKPAVQIAATASFDQGNVLGQQSEGSYANPLREMYVNPFAAGLPASAAAVSAQASSAPVLLFPIMENSPLSSSARVYPRGFTYPLEELGNCASQQSCFTYCEQVVNVPACASLAERQGLMPHGSATAVTSAARAIVSGGGPGNCTTVAQCMSLCDSVNNREACSAFAAAYGVGARVLGAADGRQVAGSNLFDSCRTEASCYQYCLSQSSAQCQQFMQRFTANSTLGLKYSRYLSSLGKNPAPGNCNSVQGCLQYCSTANHFNECLDFHQAMGFLGSDTLAYLRSGGQAADSVEYGQVLSAMDGREMVALEGSDAENGETGSDPVIEQFVNFEACVDRAQQEAAILEKVTWWDVEQADAKIELCKQQYPQPDPSNAPQISQGRQEAITGANVVQNCILRSRNLSRDIAGCLKLGQ
jgi:hypothetical protein